MSSFLHRPLLPAAIAFIAGIMGSVSLSSLLVFLLVIVPAAIIAGQSSSFRSHRLFVAILVAFAALGVVRGHLPSQKDPADVSSLAEQGLVTVQGAVAGDIQRKTAHQGDYLLTELDVHLCELPDGRTAPCRGRVHLTLPVDRNPLEFGDRIVVRGRLEPLDGRRNPGGFDYRAHMERRGIYAALRVSRTGDWRRQPEPDGCGIAHAAYKLRSSLTGVLKRTLPPLEAALATGIMIGVRSDLPAPVNDDFVVTGTAHILAASGLNVGLVAALVFGLLRPLRVPRRAAVPIMITTLVLYALVCGATPSVVRASVMASIFLLGYALDREPDGPSALAAAALILLGVSPLDLYDIGFQLSFVTVGAIFAVMTTLKPAFDRLKPPRGLPMRSAGHALLAIRHVTVSTLVVSAAAQLGAAPLIAQYFNQIPLFSMAANLFILPVLILVLASGFFVWGLSFLWAGGAQWVATFILSPILTYIIGAARLSAEIPGAVIYVASPGWFLIALYYVLLGLVLAAVSTRLNSALAATPNIRYAVPQASQAG
jgi:competence protein ComEC